MKNQEEEAEVSSIITGALATERPLGSRILLMRLWKIWYKGLVTRSDLETLVAMIVADSREDYVMAEEIITQKWEELYGEKTR